MNLLADLHIVPVLYPVADAFAGTVNTDILKGDAEGVTFLYWKAVGTTGTATITVCACDDVTPSNTTAIPFMYKISTTPDVWGNWTQATAAGFATTAGSNQVYEIYAPASNLGVTGYAYVRLTSTEVADDPVLGGVLAIQIKPNYAPVGVTKIT